VGDGGQRSVTRRLVERMWTGLGGEPGRSGGVGLDGDGSAPSPFAASDLAQASVAVAGLALAELVGSRRAPAGEGGPDPRPASGWPEVRVERSLASAWFVSSFRPLGWAMPPAWDAVAGDYLAADGWIRLHTNAPHHRAAALDVLGPLGPGPDRTAVADAVGKWVAEDLETAIVAAGGAAAAMRTNDAWARHPQGVAVAAEPLVQVTEHPGSHRSGEHGHGPGEQGHRSGERGPAAAPPPADPARPLAGVRVLDLTRVLAGPVATRFLAGYGAEVLRIDPPDWDEPSLVPDVTVGKRCARVDLRSDAGRDRLLDLLGSADVVVHGYRPGALDRLGLGEAVRRERRPEVVDVSLDAYGWSGPWAGRRGFDSLVQMSSGIAEAGMAAAGADRPVPLPFQALDHATGYLLAAAALRGLTRRSRDGTPTSWRASLARTAALLVEAGPGDPAGGGPVPVDADPAAPLERTPWGDLRRLRSPVTVGGHGLAWTSPARPLGTDQARW
jgi:hypothetical protein